jgi:hypothetical protein
MISDSNYIVYTSILKNYDILNDMYNETIRIMIFLSEFEIKIFELKKSETNLDTNVFINFKFNEFYFLIFYY